MDFTDWIECEYQNDIASDYDYYLARQIYLSIFRPNLFFVGLNPRWGLYKFLPHGLNVMYSAAGFWDHLNGKWRRDKFKSSFGLRWLDCGGFTMLNKFGDYPFSIVNLANLIIRTKPHFYAPNDYPCEPEITRSLGLMTNTQRIEATVRNTIEMAEYENQLPGQMVPVIQGYTLSEYLYCLQLHAEAGTIRDYMAVGSMCRRISNDELSNLIPGIYRAAQKVGCAKLHFFGLKLSKHVQVYNEFIWSRDSAVSLMNNDSTLQQKWRGRRFPRGQKEKKEAFMYFLQRLEELNLNYVSMQKYPDIIDNT